MPSTSTDTTNSVAPESFTQIKLLVMDFDGVLTDDRVIVGEDGAEYVLCSRSDGMGIALLKRRGLPMVILSTETNPVVTARARKLALPARQGVENKGVALRQLAEEHDVPLGYIAYVGNDVNDLDCLRLAGLAIVPGDAQPVARAHADLVLSKPGGQGAVRELADLIVASGWQPATPGEARR